MIGLAIQKRESLRLHTIVLNGSVLPRSFNSAGGRAGAGTRFQRAFRISRVMPHVHTLDSPYSTCRCPHDRPVRAEVRAVTLCDAQVHNVKHKRLDHGGF